MSVDGCVVAVTAALGADAFRDGSTATTVNEYVVAPASRRTVNDRSPVDRTFAREPFAKTRYVQQVWSSSATGPQARSTVDEVLPVTETTGAAGGVVSTGVVIVSVLLFADS